VSYITVFATPKMVGKTSQFR